MTDEVVKGIEESNETKQYTNDEIMAVIDLLPEEEKESLLNIYTFNSIKSFVNTDGVYKQFLEETQAIIDKNILLQKAATKLYFGVHSINKEGFNVNRIKKLSQALDNETKMSLAITMLTGTAIDNKLNNLEEKV